MSVAGAEAARLSVPEYRARWTFPRACLAG